MDAPTFNWKTYGGSTAWLANSATLVSGLSVTVDDAYVSADANLDKVVPAGAVIGKITSSGLCRVCTLSVLTENATDTAVVYYVDNAKDYQVGDEFTVYTGSAWLTPQTITLVELNETEGDKITVDTTLGTAVTAGESCKINDGSGTPIGVCINSCNCKDGDGAVTLAKVAHLNEKGMPYAVYGHEKTVPAVVKAALVALQDCTLTIESA